MGNVATAQDLIAGYFHCDHCGQTVDRVHKERRFWLCDSCFEVNVPQIDPTVKVQSGSPEQEAITRYWEWFGGMEERHPSRYRPPRKPTERQRLADAYFPVCDCGSKRETVRFGRNPAGLFGGPFMRECEVCRIKREVEHNVAVTSWLHPEWDDEEWLDLLYKVMPRAFELRVLPDYWYELRKGDQMASDDA